jgi:hypothetical protein
MDKKLWYKIFRKNTLISEKQKDDLARLGIVRFDEDPFDFKFGQEWSKKNLNRKDLKITYGTRTKKFYGITKNDRDWDTFSVFPKEFAKFKNEKEAIDALTRARRI